MRCSCVHRCGGVDDEHDEGCRPCAPRTFLAQVPRARASAARPCPAPALLLHGRSGAPRSRRWRGSLTLALGSAADVATPAIGASGSRCALPPCLRMRRCLGRSMRRRLKISLASDADSLPAGPAGRHALVAAGGLLPRCRKALVLSSSAVASAGDSLSDGCGSDASVSADFAPLLVLGPLGRGVVVSVFRGSAACAPRRCASARVAAVVDVFAAWSVVPAVGGERAHGVCR